MKTWRRWEWRPDWHPASGEEARQHHGENHGDAPLASYRPSADGAGTLSLLLMPVVLAVTFAAMLAFVGVAVDVVAVAVAVAKKLLNL